MNGYRRIAVSPAVSTGNDLVSLEATRPERTNLPRFYSRILTVAEQEKYRRMESSSLPFDHYVWLCWSIKESVYKYKKRQFPGLVFSPLRIPIRQIVPPSGPEGFYQASVEGPEETLYARSLIRDGVIVTTVGDDEAFTGIYWGFSSIGSTASADQSASVRGLVLEKLKDLLACEELQMQKDAAGCPLVVTPDGSLEIPISLAHHHRHIAYSFRYVDQATLA